MKRLRAKLVGAVRLVAGQPVGTYILIAGSAILLFEVSWLLSEGTSWDTDYQHPISFSSSLAYRVARSASVIFSAVPRAVLAPYWRTISPRGCLMIGLIVPAYLAIILLPLVFRHRETPRRNGVLLFIQIVVLVPNFAYSGWKASFLWPYHLGERVTAETYDGVIISRNRTRELLYGSDYNQSQMWWPTASEVAVVESKLPHWLQASDDPAANRLAERLSSFKRVYWGTERDSERYLRIRFLFKSDSPVTTGGWAVNWGVTSHSREWFANYSFLKDCFVLGPFLSPDLRGQLERAQERDIRDKVLPTTRTP